MDDPQQGSTPALTHLHVLDNVGSGGLETRLAQMRRLDGKNQHVLAIAETFVAQARNFWDGEILTLPASPSAEMTIPQAITFHGILAKRCKAHSNTILHTHTPAPAILVAATPGLAARHAHTLHGPAWLPLLNKQKPVYDHVVKSLTDQVIVVSEEMRDRTIATGVKRAPLIFSNWDAMIAPQNTAPRGKRAKSRRQVFKMAFAARLEGDKCGGLYDILTLMEQTGHKLRLDIYGTGPLLEEIAARSKALSGSVKCRGMDMGFAEKLGRYDLVLGQGRVVFEALAAGSSALVCGATIGDFVTEDNLDRLFYHNGTPRGIRTARTLSVEDLYSAPPAPRNAGISRC